MKLTTGYDFQGYVVTEYIDVIFDEMLVGMGLGKGIMATIDNAFSSVLGSEATEIIDRLNEVKRTLRDRVKHNAEKMGANALLGIDFESSKLGDLIMVSMTATAVKIEKIADFTPLTEEKKEIEEKKKEIEEREKNIQQLIQESDDDYIHKITAFITTCSSCLSFAEIKKKWSMFDFDKNELNSDIVKELEQRVYMERMYGGTTQEKIQAFIEFIENKLQL